MQEFISIAPVRQWRFLVEAAIDGGIESAGEDLVYLAFCLVRPIAADVRDIFSAYAAWRTEHEPISVERSVN